MILSHKLYDILSAWMEKAESPRPGYSVACHGLCWWVHNHAPHGSAYIAELKSHFEADGMDLTYPFEEGEADEREHSYNTDGQCHRNPRRLAWVKKKLKEYEDSIASEMLEAEAGEHEVVLAAIAACNSGEEE